MTRQHNRWLYVLTMASLASLALAAEIGTIQVAQTPVTPQAAAVGGCSSSAVSATSAHEQLMKLSSIIDPSGKLSKIINDYHPADHSSAAGGQSHKHEADTMMVAASEVEPVKRSAMEDDQAGNKTTPGASPAAANATVAQEALKTLKELVVSVMGSANTTQAPAMVAAKSGEPSVAANMSVTPTPNITEPSNASNVTVNVFLQLAPDAKTDELINNPDKAMGSSSSTAEAPTASSNSSAPSVEASPAPAANSTASTPANSTAPAAAPVSPSAGQQQPAAAPAAMASAKPSQARRRRRWANPAAAPAPAAPAPSAAAPAAPATPATPATPAAPAAPAPSSAPTPAAAPAPQPATASATQKASPSSTTTATTITTTTTPAPPPATKAAPTTTSTTTTTTTTPAPTTTSTTTTTTTAKPKPVTTTTTTMATVELSAKDLAAAASNEKASSSKSSEAPVEIVVSSMASPANAPAPTPSAKSMAPANEASNEASSSAKNTSQQQPSAGTPAVPATPAAPPAPAAPVTPAAPAAPVAPPASPVPASVASPVAPSPIVPASPVASPAAPVAPAAPAVAPVVVPVAPVASLKPTEHGPVAGMQLISGYGETTDHLTIASVNEEPKTSITKLHHSNEVKREIEAAHQRQQLASEGHQKDEQSSPPDKSSESALDNSNVIYDNDSEHINLTNQAAPTSGDGGASSSHNPQAASTATTGPIKPSSIGATQQDVAKSSLKQLMVWAANKATAGSSSPPSSSSSSSSSTSSFVHREHADETQEQQDNYATCLLIEPTEPSSGGSVSIGKLAGRLNFWQPIQNRGVAHMIARLRYDYNNNNSKDMTTNTKLDSSQQLRRRRRESFQTLIERAPPVMKDQNETTMSRPIMGNQLVHQVWLHDDDCTNAAAVADVKQEEHTQVKRKLVAELKAIVVNGTIDMDSELIIGHLNLAETNSILNKCLRISLLLVDNSAPNPDNKDQVSTSNSQQQQSSQPNELLVGYCKIVQSDSLPPVSELEQSPSVASNIQPLREDLLVSGSSLSSSSSASTITKTAPSNRKALFELM